MGPENRTVARALKWANALPGTKAIKIHGNAYMEEGTPDVLVIRQGVPLFLEGKQPGRDAEPIQRIRLKQWENVGAIVGVFHTLEEFQDYVNRANQGG